MEGGSLDSSILETSTAAETGGMSIDASDGSDATTAHDVVSSADRDDATPSEEADIEAPTDAADGAIAVCDSNAAPLPNEMLAEQVGTGGCPPGMTPIDTFCIDRYEASLRLSDADGGHASSSPFRNPGTSAVKAVSIAGAVPQAYINQPQASAACLAAGKRLCTDAEWLRACRGPSGRTYPYGDARQPGACNDARAVNPLFDYFGTSDAAIFTEMNLTNSCIDQQPSSLQASGARPGCVTAEGVYDMMGNVHEWTADPAGTFRGGFYADTVLNGNGCLYATTAHDASYWDYSTGFRCCADP